MTTAKKAAAAKGTAKAAGVKSPAKMAGGAKAPAKKAAGVKAAAKKNLAAKASEGAEATGTKRPASLARGKDPKGGLTAEGRRYFKEKEGANLRPGVQGKADTPEKMLRKGSFLRRHFANPQGPVKDAKGQPTRQALEAAAWGEPVPQSEADERKLAETGKLLLEQYHAAKDGGKMAGKKAVSKTAPGGKKGQ